MSRGNRVYWLSVIILVLSIPAIRVVPWYRFWGLDLQNIWAFHRCGVGNNPYEAAGAVCQDAIGRGMVYPPLLYWSFIWLRPLSLPQAVWAWNVAILGILGFAAWVWGREARKTPAFWGLWALTIIQMPTVFALERANSDALVVMLWSIAGIALSRRRWFLSGTVMGICALFKVYPAVSAAALGLGALLNASVARDWPRARTVVVARWLAGILFGVMAGYLIVLDHSREYFFKVLPNWSSAIGVIVGASHSIPAFFPNPLWLKFLIRSTLFVLWVRAAYRGFKEDPSLVLAGGLAIATYFPGISFDYNLMTVYPLIYLLASRVLGGNAGRLGGWALLIGIVAVFGNRQFFTWDPYVILARIQVGLQVGWLAWIAIKIRCLQGQAEQTLHPSRPRPFETPDHTPRSESVGHVPATSY